MKNLLLFSLIFCLHLIKSEAQMFHKFEAAGGGVLNNAGNTVYHAPTLVAQSSAAGFTGTIANLQDGNFTTGARTGTMGVQWVSLDLGANITFSIVQLASISTANLNGASLQVSTNNTVWTDVIVSISGSSATVINNFSFTPVTARYVRIIKIGAAVDVSEFRVVNGTSTRSTTIAGGTASGASSLFGIGFDFVFDGVAYNQFSAQVDGMMKLGSTAIVNETTNNALSTTNKPKLFPYWDNISTGTAASGGGVFHTLTGTAPNRILVVSWKNFNATASGANNVNFQVWLYETTNRIEYRYGPGVPAAAPSASIGLAGSGQTFGPSTSITQFMSVTPNAVAENSVVSYMKNNDAVAIWPGNGTVYSFVPTLITNNLSVPADMNATTIDFASLDNAIGAINWGGVPSGGVTINVQGGYTETVPAGISTTVKMSGLLLTASGTASRPIYIKWTGVGARPVLTANVGIGLNDYILGLAGSDYVTIEGLSLRENWANATAPSNNKWTELGIAMFKSRMGSATEGANGCQYNLIRNNIIRLDKRQNGGVQIKIFNKGQLFLYQGLPTFTKGIGLVYWDPLLNGGNLDEDVAMPVKNIGIVSNADLNSYNEFLENTIDSAYNGIWADDRYNGNSFVAKGNIFGRQGSGNTISNFGAAGVINYNVLGLSIYISNSMTIPKGIHVGGMYDATITGNTIINGVSNSSRVFGIEFGTMEIGITTPLNIGKVVIMNNNVRNLFAENTNLFSNDRDASGIVFTPGNNWSKNQVAQDSVIISNNVLDSFNTTLGKAFGITTGPVYRDASYTTYTDYSVISGPNKYAIISNNTITRLRATGSSSFLVEAVCAIYWGANYSFTQINNNSISRMQMGSLLVQPGRSSYFSGITFAVSNVAAFRNQVDINDNNISNNFGLASIGSLKTICTRMIFAKEGGAITNILRDTITNNTIYSASDPDASVNSGVTMIAAQANPTFGASVLNIRNNQIIGNTRMGINSNAKAYLSGIYVNNTSSLQNQNISNNTINGLRMYNDSAAVSPTISILSGIRLLGNLSNSKAIVDSNIVTALMGDKVKTNLAIINSNYLGKESNVYAVRGIISANYNKVDIRKNLIYNLIDSSVGSSDNNIDGVAGLVLLGGKANTYNASNNFIYDLSAPAINAAIGISGIYLIGTTGNYYVDHNTVVIGNPITLTPVTSSGANFGAAGIMYFCYDCSVRRASPSLQNYYTFRNNLVALQVTNKGTGASMAFRQATISSSFITPGEVTTKTNGNVYYINPGFYNYLYGQGNTANLTGGIRNCFALSGAASNPTRNLVSAPDFNQSCSRYEKFMKGAEINTYAETDASGLVSGPPPFVGGSANPGKYYLTAGSTSYAHNATLLTAGASVLDDFTAATRPSFSSTAGAKLSSGTQRPVKSTIVIDYEPLGNRICAANPTLVVNITKAVPTINVGTGAFAPRVYYKTTNNLNSVPSATQNTNLFNGWKFATPSAINGSNYTFQLDLSLIQPAGWMLPQTIEYFVVASDDSTHNGKRYITVNGTSFDSCLINVDLFKSGGNSNTAHVPQIDANNKTMSNSFDIIQGTMLNKKTEVNVNNLSYAADNTTPINVCPGDTVKLNGSYVYVPTGELFSAGSFELETATNSTFTAGLMKITSPTSTAAFNIQGFPTDLYARVWMTCNGVQIPNTNTPMVRFTTLGCPSITSVVPDMTRCVLDSVIVPIINTNTGTSATRNYFLSTSKGKTMMRVGTTTSTSTTFSTTLEDSASAGWWSAAVGLTKITINNGGFLQAELTADEDNQTADLTEQKGLDFVTVDFVRLNSVRLYDDASDGVSTSGFKLVLYEANSLYKLYETGSLTVPNGDTLSVLFSNWIIAPGKYNIVIESFNDASPMVGALLSPTLSSFPYNIGGDVSIVGGIIGNNTTYLNNMYNYFMDWSITSYCTSPADSFRVNAGESNLFSCKPFLFIKSNQGVANFGSGIGNWSDFSGRNYDFLQTTPANQPLSDTTNLINFNPRVQFGGNKFMQTHPRAFISGNAARQFIAVAVPNSTVARNPILGQGTTTNYVELYMTNNTIGLGISSSKDVSVAYSGAGTNSAPRIGSWSMPLGAGLLDCKLNVNGLPLVNSSIDTTLINNENVISFLGSNTSGSARFSNTICELLHYPYELSSQEMNVVQSYLALKWGITLDQSIAPTEYVNSSNQLIWKTSSSEFMFKNNIAGIGRDDVSGLYQKQSQSQMNIAQNTILSVGIRGIAPSNSRNNFTMENNSFLVWGDDGGSVKEQMEELPMLINQDGVCSQGKRIGREWRLQKTGNVPKVQMRFNIANTGINAREVSKFRLALSTSDNFSEANEFISASSFVNGVLTFDSVQFSDNVTYATIITDVSVNIAPGGVVRGLTSWYRTDNKAVGILAPSTGILSDEMGAYPITRNGSGAATIVQGSSNNFNFNRFLRLSGNAFLSITGLDENDVFAASAGSAFTVGLSSTGSFVNNHSLGFNSSGINGAANFSLMSSGFRPTNSSIPNIFGMIASAATNVVSYTNGTIGVPSSTPIQRLVGSYVLNLGTNGIGVFNNSSIAEAFSYNRTLDALENQQIETYLAIKYGITLDQSTPQDYISSDGTTLIWTSAANIGYNNNIAVIGRDDCSQLNQKQSRSSNNTPYSNIVAIGLGAIAQENNDNTNNFETNRSYLAWGDDGLLGFKSTEFPASITIGSCVKVDRLNKEYKVQTTGVSSAVQVRFYLSGIVPVSSAQNDFILMIDSDNNFSNGGTRLVYASAYDAANQVVDFSGVTFANGEFFTLVTNISAKAPANVSANLRLWLRADKGVNALGGVNLWEDQGGSLNHGSQNDLANQPVFKNNIADNINFNPVVDFSSGLGQRMNLPDTLLQSATGDFAIYAVSRRSSSGDNSLFSFGTNSADQYFDAGYTTLDRTNFSNTTTAFLQQTGHNTIGNNLMTRFGYNAADRRQVSVNGKFIGSNNLSAFNLVKNIAYLGANRTATQFFDGEIAELIVYQMDPIGLNNNRIESYLAIKYGITLDQTTPKNYVSSTGSIVWDGALNTGYKNRIFGIGADACSGLNQKQSRSAIDTSMILTISLNAMANTNGENTGNFTSDTTFVMIGDNGAAMTEMSADLPITISSCSKRLMRQWKVETSGAATPLEYRFDLSTAGVSGSAASDFKLLIDVDGNGNFTNGTVNMISATSYAGKVLVFKNLLIPDGSVFTLVTKEVQTGTVALTNSGSEVSTASACSKNGWVHIYDPMDTTKRLFSVFTNGNSFVPSNVKINTGSGYSVNELSKVNRLSNRAITLMNRFVQVTDATGGNDTINGGMRVRFYYSASEKTATMNRMMQLRADSSITGNIAWNWFKVEKTIPDLINTLTANGVQGPARIWITNPDTAGTEDGVDFAEFRQITEFSTFGGGAISGTLWNILPITLLEFNGTKSENQSRLSWISASEKNADHYSIERSVEGRLWSEIGKVGAKGNSSTALSYQFIDTNPEQAINYYRLKMVDADGTTEYSKTIAIDHSAATSVDMQIFPNPVQEEFTAQIKGFKGRSVGVFIYNALGEIIFTDEFMIESNEFNKTFQRMAEMHSGAYTLVVRSKDNGAQKAVKLIMQ